ncbi:hypothetical protein [Shinella zoogloeoides]|uniref:hypothetical protein n=1 Tax=Shinella zoogloeoides TaxID=352475 RepID=UPI001F569BAF|nr:hypothetical protein [Shinella zoogloeoides]
MNFQVIERNGNKTRAVLSKGKIRYRGQSLTPVAISSLMDGGAGNAIGGAVVGGLLLGGAGLVAGSVVGASRGRATFIIKVADGDELLCSTSKNDLPNLHRLLRESIISARGSISELQQERERQEGIAKSRYNATKLILGPFYFLKFGFLYFLLAALVVFFSLGIAWFFLPYWSAKIERERATSRINKLTREIDGLQSIATFPA